MNITYDYLLILLFSLIVVPPCMPETLMLIHVIWWSAEINVPLNNSTDQHTDTGL